MPNNHDGIKLYFVCVCVCMCACVCVCACVSQGKTRRKRFFPILNNTPYQYQFAKTGSSTALDKKSYSSLLYDKISLYLGVCNSNMFWNHAKGRVLNEELYAHR